MNKRTFTIILLLTFFFVERVSAAIFSVVGWIDDAGPAGMDNGVFGAIADSSCTVTPGSTPAWSSPSMPATLSAGQSVTWGYNNGHPAAEGGFANTFALRDVSFRADIRGANNNGGINARLKAQARCDAGQITVTILGPTLNSFGLNGATNFSWQIVNLNTGAVLSSGSGEATIQVSSSTGPVDYQTTVTPTNANELGSVFVSYSI